MPTSNENLHVWIIIVKTHKVETRVFGCLDNYCWNSPKVRPLCEYSPHGQAAPWQADQLILMQSLEKYVPF